MTTTATDEAEGAQALFCYLADHIGAANIGEWDQFLKKGSAYIEFKNHIGEKSKKDYKKLINNAWSQGVATKKSRTVIESYLKKNETWFISSLKIAKKLILDIEKTVKGVDPQFRYIKKPGWQHVFYKHGDNKLMGLMVKLFKQANDTSAKAVAANIPKPHYFGNMNKWNPADIYFATKTAITELEKVNTDAIKAGSLKFFNLNKIIVKLIDKGQLLPLSLKKVGLEDPVKIVKVNFKRVLEEKIIANTIVTGVGGESSGEYSETKDKAKSRSGWNAKWTEKTGIFDAWDSKFPGTYRRDIYIRIKTGHGLDGAVQFRHTPASSGRPSKGFKTTLKYPGEPGAGQVTGLPMLTKIIRTADSKFADKLDTIFSNGYTNFEKAMTQYKERGGFKITNNKLWNKISTKGLIHGKFLYSNKDHDQKFKDEYGDTKKDTFDKQVGYLSAIHIMNKFNFAIAEKFKNIGSKSKDSVEHNIVRAIFEYASSRTAKSSPFVIAK